MTVNEAQLGVIINESHQENKILKTLLELTSDFTYSFGVNVDGTLVAEWGAGAFVEVFGQNLKEGMRIDFSAFIYPEDTPIVEQRLVKLLANQEDVSEYRIRSVGGAVRWFQDRSYPIWSAELKRVVRILGASRDITAYKETLDTLVHREQELRAFIQAMPDLAFILDEDGRYCEVLSSNGELLYQPRESLQGLLMRNVLPQPLADRALEVVRETLISGMSQVFEYKLDVPIGQRWFEGRTALLYKNEHAQGHVVWISRDITARKLAEQDLQQLLVSEREQRLQAEALAEVALTLTAKISHEGVLNEILRQARRLVPCSAINIMLLEGHDLHIAHSQGYDEFGSKDFLLSLGRSVKNFPLDAEALNTQKPVVVRDTWQEPRWVVFAQTAWIRSCLIVPIYLRERKLGVLRLDSEEPGQFSKTDGQRLQPLACAAAIAIENARLYELEQQRAAELSQALAQQRELDSLKSQFIQNVSHELRTPLAIAWGYAQLLQKGDMGDLQTGQQKAMDAVTRHLKVLSKLVDDINAFLELDTRQPQRQLVNVSDIVRTLVAGVQPEANASNITISVYIDPNLPLMMGDAPQLQRVVDNLLSNACKFTEKGGRVSISLEQQDHKLVLTVADTGIGIPAEQLSRIFDRFYQVDGSATRRFGGTGLGLALVKEIVEAHDGTVTVESQLGEGSTFVVYLPLDAMMANL
ncbi:MAG: GAF domain-containing protein [Anaerolineae bacterium]|nr:GAF domain-containing protein [Anaerolineae bacterium]